MKQKIHYLLTFAFLLGILSLWNPPAFGQYLFEYRIQVDAGGIATWAIRQTTDSAQDPIDSLDLLKNKTNLLAGEAQGITGRQMDISGHSISISSFSYYVVVEYSFQWAGFGKKEEDRVSIGDVFQVDSFFEKLYGDGRVEIQLPIGYVAEKITPNPYEQTVSPQVIMWLGTLGFGTGEPTVVFREQSSFIGPIEWLGQNPLLMFLILVGVGSTLSAGIYVYLRLHKKNFRKVGRTGLSPVEDDEDKIIKLLESWGGSARQSVITEQCGFSKAKTSQLLSALEKNGSVSRFKRGRDKIVTLQRKKAETGASVK